MTHNTLYNTIIILVLGLSFAQCKNTPNNDKKIKKEEVMMIGNVKKTDFLKQPFETWYKQEYKDYKTDSTTIDSVNLNDIEIKILFGSWCSDSRREVPRFLKILDYKNYDYNELKIIGLDRNKEAPSYKNNTLNIEYVPTFVFFKNNKEIGRIIESPTNSLEKDMLSILQ